MGSIKTWQGEGVEEKGLSAASGDVLVNIGPLNLVACPP